MQKISVKEFAVMCNGKLIEGSDKILLDSVAVDSRLCKKGSVFFALPGTVTDGHLFIEKAKELNASAVVVSRDVNIDGIAVIKVDDTFKAFQSAAKAYRQRFNIPFVAVTGSSGKTTTKDIIASVLAQKYNVHKTQGNLNSSTGAPLTVFDLSDDAEISVIEMSMSHKGEILGNAEIVKPECAVITNIGMCHVEFLGTQENIFKAKCEIFEYFDKKNTLLYNSDDPWLVKLKDKPFGTIGFGIESGDVKAFDIIQSEEGVSFSIKDNGGIEKYHFRYPGIHNVRNCLCAIAIGKKYGLSSEEIQTGLSAFQPGSNRMQIAHIAEITLINDTYNANPDAMNAALTVLNTVAHSRRIAVLGDMLELGDQSKALHFGVGKSASKHSDLMFVVGNFSQDYIDGYLDGGGSNCKFFSSKKELGDYLLKVIKKGDTVLFKASRGVQLDEVFKTIQERLSKI